MLVVTYFPAVRFIMSRYDVGTGRILKISSIGNYARATGPSGPDVTSTWQLNKYWALSFIDCNDRGKHGRTNRRICHGGEKIPEMQDKQGFIVLGTATLAPNTLDVQGQTVELIRRQWRVWIRESSIR